MNRTVQILGKPVELDVIKSFKSAKIITSNGIYAVRNRLDDFTSSVNSYYLESEIGREWMKQKGEYTGSFPKRVKKWMKQKGYKMSADQISDIGNVARQHCPEGSTHWYSFTDCLDWDDGDFDDEGSCFWGGYSIARHGMMADGRWIAIRTHFADDPLSYGTGRAWVRLFNDVPVVMNGYGHQTRSFAMFLSIILDTPYHEVELYNTGETGYYFNGNGFAICQSIDDIDYDNRYNNRPGTLDINMNCGPYCYECETFKPVYDYNYGRACLDCLYQMYNVSLCNECNEIVGEDDSECQDGEIICNDCLYTSCDWCSAEILKDDVVISLYRKLCQECATEAKNEN